MTTSSTYSDINWDAVGDEEDQSTARVLYSSAFRLNSGCYRLFYCIL